MRRPTRSRALLVAMLALAAVVVGGVVLEAAQRLSDRVPRGAGGSAFVPVVTGEGSPRLRQPDGSGQAAVSYEGAPPLSTPTFFPVAVWFESVQSPDDIARDRAAGLNTYLELTADSDVELARADGMRVITSGTPSGADGYLLPDEVDMWAGPGSADWTGSYPGEGDICDPAGAACGWTVIDRLAEKLPDSTYVWGQFGKGVTMWESTDEARQFVNGPADGVSADLYWFTDPNICGASEGGVMLGVAGAVPEDECRRASNYGLTVDKVRSLVAPAGSKPVWVFVEVGHPFTEDDAPTIGANQIADAVWSGVMHGAQGVVYFNHSFGGSCESQHVLRDDCGSTVRDTVTEVNEALADHAALLHAPFADGIAVATGGLDASVKLLDGRLVVLAGRTGNQATTGELRFACDVGATAVDETSGEVIPIEDGSLVLEIGADTPVRVLDLAEGRTCGLS